MAASDKNVSPEERLLNVIRGKDGKDSKDAKVSQAASASVDEEAPPLDEAPPPSVAAAPVAPAVAKSPAPVSSAVPSPSPAPASTTIPPATASLASEPQTTGPRTRGPLGDEKLKAALSRKVSERTRGEDKPATPGIPRGMGGAAAAIARAATQDTSSSSPGRGSAVPVTGDVTRFIAKKIQGDTAPGIRYVSMSFAAVILIVVLFSAYEIVAAINMEPISPPPRIEGSEAVEVPDPLEPNLLYQLVPLQEGFKHDSLFGQLRIDDPTNVNPLSIGPPPWVKEFKENFVVSGRLGDPAKGGELILRDKRDNKQYFIGLDSGMDVAGMTVYLKALERNRGIFHDKRGNEAELNW